jgi:hypothetical protein
MQVNRHESICHVIDKTLVGAASLQEEQSLREHLLTCDCCREYLSACHRAITGLEGFSFDMNPGLDTKVLASLAVRAQELETKRIQRKQLWWNCFLALMLTAGGSFVASRLGAAATTIFHLEPAQMQFGLLAFWIAPSLAFCLLFLLLPVSSSRWMKRKGLSL